MRSSTVPHNTLSTISNGGERIDLAAPGFGIYSTIASAPKYGMKDGTSMAAPMVTGVAGLVWSINPNFTGAQVRNIVCNSFDPDVWVSNNSDSNTTSPNSNGYRMVNAKLAVEEAMRQTYTTGTFNAVVKDKDTNDALDDVSVIMRNTQTNKICVTRTYSTGIFSLLLATSEYYLHNADNSKPFTLWYFIYDNNFFNKPQQKLSFFYVRQVYPIPLEV